MKDEVELLTDAINVTAVLIKENTELKRENNDLRRSLRWCWNHAGIIFMKKFLERTKVERKSTRKEDIDRDYNKVRNFIDRS